MTNRRKFLERSALGAGSVVFLPGLLSSCTDHRVLGPGTPTPPISVGTPAPPILVGEDGYYDLNDSMKTIISNSLADIPIAGPLFSSIIDIFWPDTTQDVWSEVKDQVEELVNQKISDLVYQLISEDLQGLKNTLPFYAKELEGGTPNSKLTQWMITRTLFAQALPHFQPAQYNDQILSLPLFTQFANLYLSVLRDGIIAGKSWGMTEAVHQDLITDMKKNINDFVKYAQENAYLAVRDERNRLSFFGNLAGCDFFKSINTYERVMTLAVFDYTTTWPYFDVTQYPTGAKVEFPLEIYSDPLGPCGENILAGLSTLYPPTRTFVPTGWPTRITVWGGSEIDGVQVTYPAGGGPDGATQTPQMGRPDGGSNQPPVGGTVTILDSTTNPIYNVLVNVPDGRSVASTMQFMFADGLVTPMFGGGNGKRADWPNPIQIGYKDHALSRIHISAGTNDGLVFGFKYFPHPNSTLRALRTLYIKSPQERSVADFVSAHSTHAIATNLLNEEEELKKARQAYWASIRARAKAPK